MRRQGLALALMALLVGSGLMLARPAPVLALTESSYSAFKTVGAGHTLPNGALGGAVGGGVYWYTKRSQAAAP